LGHKWTEATCTAPKTCQTCGETEGAALGHQWTTAGGKTVCGSCGTTKVEDTYDIGDITGDGKVNVMDVARLYAHVNKANPITDELTLARGDVNGDGYVNIADVAALYAQISKQST
jgi:hypothetical protein